MGFEGCGVIVGFDEGEEVGLMLALADLEAAATGFVVAGVGGFFSDPGDELIDAVGVDFDGDEE